MFIFRGSDVVPIDGLKAIPTKKPGETLLDVYQALPQRLKDEASEIYTACLGSGNLRNKEDGPRNKSRETGKRSG